MTVKEIYEKVIIMAPMEQRKFFNLINDSIDELSALYSDFITISNVEQSKISDLSDSLMVEPLYHVAIVDNILFLAGAGEFYKNEFIRKTQNVHKQLWSKNTKGKRVKRNRW